jgi:PPK2 family polyphosphate:nucleotide phosphotransferase
MQVVRLTNISTRAPVEFEKLEIKKQTAAILEELDELQNLLYASSQYAVLVIIQGIDASGKDGVIKNVFGTLNPQGVTVKSFKAPTAEELSHDFLWRVHSAVPSKGMIQIFNRSHYEDILVTRVHKLCDDETAKKRIKAINDFEELLQEHGNTIILKFYLHVSKEKQAERLQERIDDPKKQWKYNPKDDEERKRWDEYVRMYEECFEYCSRIPWVIVPSDQNWYKEYVIAKTLLDALRDLRMEYPRIKNISKKI